MTIPGYADYERRAYCKDIQCPVQLLLDKQTPGSSEYNTVRQVCIEHCIHSTYEFHHWLIEKGYLVVRPQA